MQRLTRLVLVSLPVIFPATAAAQTDVLDSYVLARQQLTRAIDAHGGREAILQGRILVRVEGADVRRNQSVGVEPPYDRERATAELHVDIAGGVLAYTYRFGYPGGFQNHNRIVIRGVDGFDADLIRGTYITRPGRALWQMRTQLSVLPQLVLLAADADAVSLRWLGKLRVAGEVLPSLAVATPQGAQLTLSFDPRTHLLRAVSTVINDPVVGDATQVVVYEEYRRISGWTVPARRRVITAGETTADLSYVAFDSDHAVPDSILQREGLRQAASQPAIQPVIELASHVWMLLASGYSYGLAVEQADHIVMIAAPLGSANVIRRLQEMVPGKPIRYVVLTHHHTDHAGGVREFIADGATVITTPGNRAFIERIAQARRTLSPDALTLRPAPTVIETFRHQRTLGIGPTRIELHEIGPTPHAREMIVAWLPAHGILFQSDLLNLDPDAGIYSNSGTDASSFLEEWIERHGLPVRVLAGVHLLPGPLALLRNANQKRVRAYE